MIPALLIVLASWNPAQSWAWDQRPVEDGVTHYRLYTNTNPGEVWPCEHTEYAAADVCDGVTCSVPLGELPLGWQVWFQVTPANAAGERWPERLDREVCP